MLRGATDQVQVHLSQHRGHSKLIFRKIGDAAVLEFRYLYGTAGLSVGCDPVLALEQHVRSTIFDGRTGLSAGYKSGLSPFYGNIAG